MDVRAPQSSFFCVNPGRSGSYFLSRLFNLAPDVCAAHEPEHEYPAFAALNPSRWSLRTHPLEHSFDERRAIKLAQVQDLLAGTSARTYVETNPMFGTLWSDVILGQPGYGAVGVIVLRRRPAKVLKSILDLGWYSTRNGDDWMLSAFSVNSLFKAPWDASEASAMDLVIGHLVNVELSARKIASYCETHEFPLVEVDSEDLFEGTTAAQRLFEHCEIPVTSTTLREVARLGHNKPSLNPKAQQASLQECEKGLERYLVACEDPAVRDIANYWLGADDCS